MADELAEHRSRGSAFEWLLCIDRYESRPSRPRGQLDAGGGKWRQREWLGVRLHREL